ncbi:MAG: HAMP domain-containing histidine kinase [Actinobacteria bacterium]|nr:MAG: HAMP domain-containing histidine kinase [Actinomycetota bacterium]
MAQAHATVPASPPAAVGGKRRRLLSRADNPLVRAVAHLPAKVRTKLLVAFLGIAALLVLVALLGLRVLGQANSRAERLGALQVRVAGYQALEADAATLRQVLALCTGTPDYAKWLNGGKPAQGSAPTCLRTIRQPVDAVLALLGTATQLEFRPTTDEVVAFRHIKKDYANLKGLVGKIAGSSAHAFPLHARAENLSVDLEVAARRLAESTTAKTNALIAENRRSYVSSRNLFIGVGAGTVFLALFLGFVLSWSLIGPLQRIGGRLAGIASGDFSGRVDVANRDELGALATNVNRMNDELRRVYRELESASRHKSEFLANMSHELRTPLNAIIGFSQVLRERMFGEINEKQQEYLEDILSSGNHLLSLINDVLDLSKVEAGQVELEINPFSLREALERGLVMVRERATKDGVQLVLELDPAAELVEGDERRIRQVIFNLLSNAVKFTPPGGRVELKSARLDGEIRVSVTDTGPGIATEDQERIFEEFQQTEAGAGQREGTGLGLALSKRLVELHGGRIWVDSEPGEGSAFVFTLPSEATST